MILENLAEIVLENILPHDYANETLHEIDGAIAAVEWEMEPLEVELISVELLFGAYVQVHEDRNTRNILG